MGVSLRVSAGAEVCVLTTAARIQPPLGAAFAAVVRELAG
jgi:hypothetical protein